MKSYKYNFKYCSVRIIGLFIGVTVFTVYKNGIDSALYNYLQTIYNKVGITIIALVPLLFWAVNTVLNLKDGAELTLSYIGTTAQRIGLLGTVIGIVAATITIGDNLGGGAANAVTGALPAVGQALVSTAVGFVIAIICDFFIYLNSRQQYGETENVEE